ncbi:MAG: transporter ATP-binding protein [Solirubrobacterales bacterium]|nr:transporter ATP-binding protein [Solirubrobacterales bacterium]
MEATPAGLSSHDEELIRLCATNLLEIVPQLAVAMARHIHEQLPEIGALDDEPAVDATRASCESNIREICTMLRAGLPASANETPSDALEYVRFMRSRGVGFAPVLRAYEYGVSMLGPVAAAEFQRRADDERQLTRTLDAVRRFVWSYIDRLTERLGEEYGIERPPSPGLDAPVWSLPASAEAARAFLEQIAAAPGDPAGQATTQARARAERSLERLRAAIESASRDEHLAQRLGLAHTTVRISLADEPDLALTLTLDGSRIAATGDADDAEVDMTMSSADLERLSSEHFNLAMAIARGRVRVSGPVRKFLRVAPIIRELSAHINGHATEAAARAARAVGVAPHDGGDGEDEESQFSPETQALLDKAADYEYELHQGALGFDEEQRGYFWSIECRAVYKSFGRNRVLNGLDVGIPEGMITVVLGPSGTGKSVLISHLIGLMFPDQGEVLVHGRSVSEMRMSELLEMRRRVGILFQDGALFGSMNVYDNDAFPLRQHTDYSEEQIAAVVHQRLAEVGLSGAGDRAPSELSGGMRKRAGFARALVLDPEIVMFDEPDSGLDPVRTALLCELIQQMHTEHGGTYIVITHDIASARRIAEYLVVLWKGQIVQAGDRDDMFTSRNPFVRQFLAGQARGPLGME